MTADQALELAAELKFGDEYAIAKAIMDAYIAGMRDTAKLSGVEL